MSVTHCRRATGLYETVVRPPLPNVCSLSPSRIRDADGPAFDLARIQRGVLFIHAVWSGPSKVMLQRICAAMISRPGHEFWLADHDSWPHAELDALFARASGLGFSAWGGNGEVLAIRDGQVIGGARYPFDDARVAAMLDRLR